MGTLIAIAGIVGLFLYFNSALDDLRRRVKKTEDSDEEIRTTKSKVAALYDAINGLIEYLSTKQKMSDLRAAIELKRQITELEEKSTAGEFKTEVKEETVEQPSPQPGFSSPKIESKSETVTPPKGVGVQPSKTRFRAG